jgi:hypothetical protein
MKKGKILGILIISLLVLSVSFSFISASWFSDFWEKITGWAVSENAEGIDCNNLVGLYKFYNSQNEDYYYVLEDEKNDLINNSDQGYKYITTQGYVFKKWFNSTIPLYVFWNKETESHFYTLSSSIKTNLSKNSDWEYKGIIGYVYSKFKRGTSAFYEFYNPSTKKYFYTNFESEKKNFSSNKAWTYKGVRGYLYTKKENCEMTISSSSQPPVTLVEPASGTELTGVLGVITDGTEFYNGFSFHYYTGNLSSKVYDDGKLHLKENFIWRGSEASKNNVNRLLLYAGHDDIDWKKFCDINIKTALEACKKVYPDTNYAEITRISLMQRELDIEERCKILAIVNNSGINKFCNEFKNNKNKSNYEIIIGDGLVYNNWTYCGTKDYPKGYMEDINDYSSSARYPYGIFCYKTDKIPAEKKPKNVVKEVCEDDGGYFLNMFKANKISLYSVKYDENGKVLTKDLVESRDSNNFFITYWDNLNSYKQFGINNYLFKYSSTKFYCIKGEGNENDSIGLIGYVPCKYGYKEGRCCHDYEDPLECQFVSGNIKQDGITLAHDSVKKAINPNFVDLNINVKGASNPKVYLHYKEGTDIENDGWKVKEMSLNSGTKNNGVWKTNLNINSLNIPKSTKNWVYNGDMSGDYGEVKAGHSPRGSIVPCVGNFFVEWKNANKIDEGSSVQKGCYNGKCQYMSFDVAKVCPPKANQGKVGGECEVSYFVYFPYKKFISEIPYIAKAKIKQTGGDKGDVIQVVINPHSNRTTINNPGRFFYWTHNASEFISYEKRVFLGSDMRQDWKIYFNNVPMNNPSTQSDQSSARMRLGADSEWKQMEWIFKIPPTIYAPYNELRFVMGNAKNLWIDNIEVAPLYPGVQYYIEVVDDGKKYYENSWLYKKVKAGWQSEFVPYENPHFIITSDKPLQILPNQPSSPKEWQDNNRCV